MFERQIMLPPAIGLRHRINPMQPGERAEEYLGCRLTAVPNTKLRSDGGALHFQLGIRYAER